MTIIDNDSFTTVNDLSASTFYYERIESSTELPIEPPTERPTMPQTGIQTDNMLFLPIPLLLTFGLLLGIVGVILIRRGKT